MSGVILLIRSFVQGRFDVARHREQACVALLKVAEVRRGRSALLSLLLSSLTGLVVGCELRQFRGAGIRGHLA